MLATSRYLVKRVPTVLQQYRTAATASTPTRRTWTAYKKPSPSAPAATAPPPVPEQEEAFTPLPELEPPSSVEPLPSTSTSISTNNRTSLDLSPPASSSSSTSTLSSAPLPTLSTQLAPSYPTPTPTPTHQQEIDWSTSFHGISSQPFSSQQAQTLMRPLLPNEIEIKPDGLLYLPEILYRRILNQAFGPGGWGMVPRGEMTVMKGLVTREWGLVAAGRLISLSRGEQTYFDPSGLPTATEGCKSNALMRCCKDLGIASELWDPAFIRTFKAQHCVEAWTEHGSTKKKQKRWRKKGNKFEYPLKEAS